MGGTPFQILPPKREKLHDFLIAVVSVRGVEVGLFLWIRASALPLGVHMDWADLRRVAVLLVQIVEVIETVTLFVYRHHTGSEETVVPVTLIET